MSDFEIALHHELKKRVEIPESQDFTGSKNDFSQSVFFQLDEMSQQLKSPPSVVNINQTDALETDRAFELIASFPRIDAITQNSSAIIQEFKTPASKHISFQSGFSTGRGTALPKPSKASLDRVSKLFDDPVIDSGLLLAK